MMTFISLADATTLRPYRWEGGFFIESVAIVEFVDYLCFGKRR